MDEARFLRLVAFTREAFMSPPQWQWLESPAESRLRSFQALPERGRDEYLQGLIVESADNKLAWDSVKLIAENLLRGEKPLLVELRQWVADILSDQYKQTKDKCRPRPAEGGSSKANRDWVICGAIHHIGLRFDLPPTRNNAGPDKCCAAGGPACDVVGAAAFEADIITYKNTERIWGKRDPILSYSIRKKD